MKNSEDYFTESLAFPKGQEKSRLLEKAAELAELEGLEEEAFDYRYKMINALQDTHDDQKTIAGFSWLLNQYDKNPELHRDRQDNVLWLYKWVIDSTSNLPTIPYRKVKSLIDDYSRRIRQKGFSDYSIHIKLMHYHNTLGEYDESEKHYQKILTSRRDEHCDCIACVPLSLNSHLYDKGRFQEAWNHFRPVLTGQKTCLHVPSLAWPEIALLALRSEQSNHRKYYRNAWAGSLKNREVLNYRENMLEYIWRQNLAGDFRRFMLEEFNLCANNQSQSTQLYFLVQVEAAMISFEVHLNKIEFCEGLHVGQENITSWQLLRSTVSQKAQKPCEIWDKRIGQALTNKWRLGLIEEARNKQEEVNFELSAEASGTLLKRAAKITRKPISESFEDYRERYFAEITPINNWQKKVNPLSSKTAKELLAIIRDQQGVDTQETYAALNLLRKNYVESFEYSLALWTPLYGNKWTEFGSRLIQQYSDSPNSLKQLVPDLLRWPGNLSEYALRQLLAKADKKDQSWALLKQAILWDKRQKNEKLIYQNLGGINKEDLSESSDIFDFAMLVKNFGSVEESVALWECLTIELEGYYKHSAYVQWSYLLSHEEQWQPAEEKLLIYLEEAEAPSPHASLELSWVLRKLDRVQDALPHALTAIEKLPTDYDAQMEVALIYWWRPLMGR